MKKTILIFFTALVSLIFLIFFVYLRSNDRKLHLVVCDVGQGDAIFIRTASQADILIDGGPDKKVLECLGRHMPFWDRSLDIIILTHPDADHVTGLIDVIERYKIRYLLTQPNPGKTQIYELFTNVLAEKKLSAKYVSKGEGFSVGGETSFKILWPASPGTSLGGPASDKPEEITQNSSNPSLNRFSVISVISYGKFSALLTGDAGSEIQDAVAPSARDIDILKVPHHGSKTGMNDYILDQTTPDLAIISVGSNNRYGHPSRLSLDLLKKHNIKVLRTDQMGEIEIVSDGLTWSVKTSRN